MRVREHLDAMPPADQQHLLNQLTVGCGRVLRTARLVLADAPCGTILDALTAGQPNLVDAAAQLDGTAVAAPPARGDPGGAKAGLRALSWQDFLATQRPAEATVLRTDLAALADQTRALVRAVQDNEDTVHITRQLHATLAALSDLHERLAAAVEP
jgi:DNA-binding FrmR family transcriptional regulator